MKTTFKAALATLAILGATSAARADLTLQGAVGLPLNPTAQIPSEGGVRVQGSYYDLGEIAGNDFRFMGLHAAGRVADRFEINGGVSRLDAKGFFDGLDKTGLDIGAKYLFTRESDPAGVRIAAGAGHSRALLRNTYAYLVGSKSFGRGISGDAFPITGHLGLRYDRFRVNQGGFQGKSNKASIYGGIEVPFTREGNFAFVGELQSKNADNGQTPYSASLRFRPAGQGFSASVGIQRQGAITRDNGLFAQIGYTFGGSTAGDEANAPVPNTGNDTIVPSQ